MSVATQVLLVDVEALKNPAEHAWHWGWAETEPTSFVYVPGGHLVWGVQESVVVPLLDLVALKNPVAHSSHSDWVVAVPGVLVYFPGGHLACGVHW